MTRETFEIRAATCCINSRAAFLQEMRQISEDCSCHIICFNADLVAGRQHILSAIQHAIRSFETGRGISKSIEMEALLYTAGSRQTSVGSEFGIHIGENRMYVCCYPGRTNAWEALSSLVIFCTDSDPWQAIDPEKKRALMEHFSITDAEISTTLKGDLLPLILERVTLLDVNK